MKRVYLTTIISALLVILAFRGVFYLNNYNEYHAPAIKAGFLYVGDESTPYTMNFVKAQRALETKFGDSVETVVMENVAEGTEEDYLRELVADGCDIIFTTSYGYGDTVKKLAGEYPDIQFCQASSCNANDEPVYSNYHTFMGYIYQGRYVSGVVAGLKLKELIEQGKLTADEAVIGYVAAFPYAEVISGYTSFFLGVRSIVPEATMKVKYTNTWSSYGLEKKAAKELIDMGCVVISQHSDTIGPAFVCENAASDKIVYHVGYNQSMMSIAPTTSLVSCRINWEPYIVAAVQAVQNGQKIEEAVTGIVNGNDVGAGFKENWVQMLDINQSVAADGTSKTIEKIIEDFKNNRIEVFKGDYIGVDPFDSSDVCDLSQGYVENESTSAPTFHYVLQDVIEIVE